jgi:hypothetical protein
VCSGFAVGFGFATLRMGPFQAVHAWILIGGLVGLLMIARRGKRVQR